MAGQIGQFTMRHFRGWGAQITKRNHISSLFGAKGVQKVSGVMVQLMAFEGGTTFDTMLSGLPVKEFESGDDYVWDVIGSTDRLIPLIEARDENGTVVTHDPNNPTMVGAGTAPFYLVFREHWFFKGETIEGNLGNRYPLRVLEDPKEEGSNYVYKVETMAGITAGVPSERLKPGELFSYGAAFVEGGLSRRVGGIRHAVPVTVRNEWSHIRIHHKVSGDVMDDKLAIALPIKEGNKGIREVHTWMHNVDFELEKTFRNYKNYAWAWGRSNRNANGEYMNIGVSGDAIRTGAGLFEQIERGNVFYYNDFSLKLIENALYDLFAGRTDFNKRKVTLKTGEKGGALFQKAALKDGSGWKAMFDFEGTNLGLIQKTSNKAAPYGGALKVVAPQVTEFVAPMGIAITLEIDMSYDNINHSGYKVMHPLGGPASSYIFDILDLGSSVSPNIQKCKIKGHPEECRGYEAGMRNPFTGAWDNDHMSNDEDAATIHKMADSGIVVWDPTRTMRIIPDILE